MFFCGIVESRQLLGQDACKYCHVNSFVHVHALLTGAGLDTNLFVHLPWTGNFVCPANILAAPWAGDLGV